MDGCYTSSSLHGRHWSSVAQDFTTCWKNTLYVNRSSFTTWCFGNPQLFAFHLAILSLLRSPCFSFLTAVNTTAEAFTHILDYICPSGKFRKGQGKSTDDVRGASRVRWNCRPSLVPTRRARARPCVHSSRGANLPSCQQTTPACGSTGLSIFSCFPRMLWIVSISTLHPLTTCLQSPVLQHFKNTSHPMTRLCHLQSLRCCSRDTSLGRDTLRNSTWA